MRNREKKCATLPLERRWHFYAVLLYIPVSQFLRDPWFELNTNFFRAPFFRPDECAFPDKKFVKGSSTGFSAQIWEIGERTSSLFFCRIGSGLSRELCFTFLRYRTNFQAIFVLYIYVHVAIFWNKPVRRYKEKQGEGAPQKGEEDWGICWKRGEAASLHFP